jgi:F-type H+-transporting ATPase subunit gamma
MPETLRQIKSRIQATENTAKITRAMEMISVAKLKAAESALAGLRGYFSKLQQIAQRLMSSPHLRQHPLFEERKDPQRLTLCVIASDMGLCGNYNYSVLRIAEQFIRQNSHRQVELIAVGRKVLNYCKKSSWTVSGAYMDLYGRYSQEVSAKIAQQLSGLFLEGTSDAVYIAYMDFQAPARYRPTLEKILNITPAGESEIEYITEPEAQDILGELLPLYILSKFSLMMLSAFAAEHSARGIAMGEATDNAEELLDELVLLRNKERQANITRELIEVISAAEAMRD